MALPRAKLGVSLFRHPCRKPLSPVKGCVCLVGSASCRAFGHTHPASVPGLNVGLPPLNPVGGYAPKQGCFGCLPKVLHDAKPAEQAILDIPFLITIKVFRQTEFLPAENRLKYLKICDTIRIAKLSLKSDR